MSFLDLALAIFLGNAITIAFLSSLWQLHKKDEQAPIWAYALFILPLLFVLGTLWITEGSTPHFDALAPQQAASIRP